MSIQVADIDKLKVATIVENSSQKWHDVCFGIGAKRPIMGQE
jgi:hypothetical protein